MKTGTAIKNCNRLETSINHLTSFRSQISDSLSLDGTQGTK